MDFNKDIVKENEIKLLKKREQIVLEIKRLKKEDPFVEESKDPEGRNLDSYEDEANEQRDHDETTQKISELEQTLTQIDKALLRIKNGTYGFDENTNEPISIDRLIAYPEATTAK